ncbi:hypothetical protein P8S55_16165 [Halomonas sp. M1]|uniref:hypothetical protein n=1 Tax=Halomonas sp. M1 TaxID=3035470 RepID=UPI00279885A0|nr:hypothetical protein P8S55_16165 [Halomonas sp. M1]
MPPPSFLATTATASGLRSGYQRDHLLTQQRLRCEKVRLLYDNLWQPVLSSVLAGGLLVAAMWPVVNAVLLVGWFVTLAVVSGLRLSLAYRLNSCLLRSSSATAGCAGLPWEQLLLAVCGGPQGYCYLARNTQDKWRRFPLY